MKLYLKLVILLALFSVACSNEEEAPAAQIVVGDKTFNMSKAKIYLAGEIPYSNTVGKYKYRNYFITDGTWTSGNGWDMTHYPGGTYFFAIQILVPETSSFAPGTYQSYFDYIEVPKTGRGIYFYGEDQARSGAYYESKPNATAQYQVKGGFNVGESIEISYNGDAMFWVYSTASGWSKSPTSAKLFYSGTIINK